MTASWFTKAAVWGKYQNLIHVWKRLIITKEWEITNKECTSRASLNLKLE